MHAHHHGTLLTLYAINSLLVCFQAADPRAPVSAEGVRRGVLAAARGILARQQRTLAPAEVSPPQGHILLHQSGQHTTSSSRF